MKYFSIEELTQSRTAEREGIDNTPNKRQRENLQKLVTTILDPFRENVWTTPLYVTSGFRSKALNQAVGGVSTSLHTEGRAVDLIPKNGQYIHLFNVLRRKIDEYPIEELIYYKDKKHTHIAYSENPRREIFMHINGRYEEKPKSV
jgi:hypothetical protein